MHLEGYGCAGTIATAYGLACLELEAGDSGIRSFVSVQGHWPCSRSGSSAPKSRSRPGSPGWRAARSSAASASPSPTPAPTRRRCGPTPSRDGVRLGAQRHQDVDHQRRRIADVAIVWARTDEGVRGFIDPHRHARVLRPGDQEEGVASGLGDLGADPRRRPTPRRLRPPRRVVDARAAVLSQRGAVRDRIRGDWGGTSLLRVGPRLFDRAAPVRPADRLVPAHPEEAGRDDGGGAAGNAAGPASRAPQGRGDADTRAGQLWQVRQRAQRARGCPRPRAPSSAPTESPSSTR